MTKAIYNKRINIVDVYFSANFDGTKVPFNTTKAYKTFAAQCKVLIECEHSATNFDDYTSKKDAYQSFNAELPSYDKLASATATSNDDIWA